MVLRGSSGKDLGDLAFTLLAAEALFGGFYVSVTRGVTPIFLVSQLGMDLKELLVLNFLAGASALMLSGTLYRFLKGGGREVRIRLIASLIVERVLWLFIPFSAGSNALLTLMYAGAVASTIPTGIFLYSAFLTYFQGTRFRKLIAYRTMGSSISSIAGQLTSMTVLALGKGLGKYILLYVTAFSVGLVSVGLAILTPLKGVRITHMPKVEEEVDIQAVNTFILLLFLMTGVNLLNLAWVPRLINDLHTPDYFPALLTATQTLTAITASLFWIRRGVVAHRVAILALSGIPPLIYLTPNPWVHPAIAVLYSFTLVGANLYVSSVYSDIVKRLGTLRASTLLATSNSAALTLGSALGLSIAFSELGVFMASSVAMLAAMFIALTAIKGLEVVPERYSRMYARILYSTGLAGYNAVVISAERTAKATIKLTALLITLSILFIIYRTLYYVIILSRGGG